MDKCDKQRSPIRGKDRSSSINSSFIPNRVNYSPKKIISSDSKSKMVHSNLSKYGIESKKSVQELQGCSLNDQRNRKLSGKETINITGDIKESLNEKVKSDQKKKCLDEIIAKEGSIEKLLKIKNNSKTVFNFDGMSGTQFRESLDRVDENTVEPFSFLNGLNKHTEEEMPKLKRISENRELNPTDVDLQLASLVKRVELNRTLLERANQRIKDINFLAEKKKAISIREMDYNEESFLKFKKLGDASTEPVSAADLPPVSHPAIDELQKTMAATIQMLDYVHAMSSSDLVAGEIPPALTDYLNTPITSRENI